MNEELNRMFASKQTTDFQIVDKKLEKKEDIFDYKINWSTKALKKKVKLN